MPFRKPHQTANPIVSNNWIENKTKCVIQPKGLNIIWGNDPRYWNITNECAELIQVSWLEVSGKVKVDKGEKYIVKFYVDVKPEGFGWVGTDVLLMAKVGKKGLYTYVPEKLDGGKNIIPESKDLEIDVKDDETDLELHFGLYEVWSGKWKGGLKINKAEILKKS